MALALTFDQRRALRRGAIKMRTLVDLYLDSGRYSFWDGAGHAELNGVYYLAAGAVGSVSGITLGTGLGAEGIEIRLDGTRLIAESYSTDDPAALLATFFSENYHLRRVEISYAFFDAETDALILVQRRFAGLIDQARLEEQLGDDGAREILVLACESVARRYGRRTGRIRAHEDQSEIWGAGVDDFFKFCAPSVTGERSLKWGKK
jgi:hypothetical protein